MKSTDIGNIINKFIESNATAIMFAGDWGIGKTYEIQQFLLENRYKKESKECSNIHYISLFGFKNTEILHKELYKKFHPHKARGIKALNYISLAVSLNNASIGLNTSKIKNDIEDTCMDKPLFERNYKNIIIFDDVERVSVKQEGFIELFGYFNRVINEGVKIITICNSNELANENKKIFDKFKEKIFDRIYTINENNIEVIMKILGKTFDLLEKEDIKFFENNLRFVKKAKVFIDDTLNQLSKTDDSKVYDDRTVCLICIMIIKEVFTSCFSKELYNEYKKKLESNNKEVEFYTTLMIEKYGTDDFSIDAIEEELKKRQIPYERQLINGLFDYFKYFDLSYFAKKPAQSKLLEKSLFYYNDKDKSKIIKEVVDRISLEIEKFEANQIFYAISEILKYSDEIIEEDDTNKLVTSILNVEKSKQQEIFDEFEHIMMFETSENEARFIKILKEKIREQDKESALRYLKNINIDTYDRSLKDWINKSKCEQGTLYPEIREYLKESKFLLPDLSETLSENAWRLCHDMCSFVVEVDLSLKEDLIRVLKEQQEKHSEMKCVKERVESLRKMHLT